ncbi:MAG: hypothetical protein KJ950_06955 [Proteobacteria bacterium]|nr:hypothetical protein [Pseudomonadota bacterium]MBU1686985.1 hypothetical protein [Pseudomonadota bacterium]
MKLISFSYLFIFLFTIISCVGCSGSNDNNTDDTTSNDTTAPPQNSVHETISDLNGGRITTGDNSFIMAIDPGALNEDTEITITPQDDLTAAVGYELEPDGLTFNTPATITIETDSDELGELQNATGHPEDLTHSLQAPFAELESTEGDIELLTETISNLLQADNSTGLSINTGVNHFSRLTIRNPKSTIVARSTFGFSTSPPAYTPFSIPIDLDILKNPQSNQKIVLETVRYTSFTSIADGAVSQDQSIQTDLQELITTSNSGQAWWGDSAIDVPLPIADYSLGNYTCEQPGNGSIQLDLKIRYRGKIGSQQSDFDHTDTISIRYLVNCTDSGQNPDPCQTDCYCGNNLCEESLGETASTCKNDCGTCGDSFCAWGNNEDSENCPDDCFCGNNICEDALEETADNCANDCGTCGDGYCAYGSGENYTSCFDDCHCGNNICDNTLGETADNCANDCGICGDGYCAYGSGENYTSCFDDCHCGNAICESNLGETATNCPNDCGFCGDGHCAWNNSEDYSTCLADCHCGNAICDDALGETETNCPNDCGFCGDGHCAWNNGENPSLCAADCSS